MYPCLPWVSNGQNPAFKVHLGPVYTTRQHQRCDNSAVTLAILFSLKTMESLLTGVATHFKATPLFSMRTISLVSLRSGRSLDIDAWCKRTVKVYLHWMKANAKANCFGLFRCLACTLNCSLCEPIWKLHRFRFRVNKSVQCMMCFNTLRWDTVGTA